MSHRLSVRTVIAALTGSAILALGAATATAEPQRNPEFPLGTQNESPGNPGTNEFDEQAERVQDVGGQIITRIIDMGADVTKCVINLVAPNVPCA